MSRKREWIGIVLLAVSLIGFVCWEKWGRPYYRMTDVIVAAGEIPAGTELTPSLFMKARVETESAAEGALTPSELYRITGKKAAVTIPKNGQIFESILRDADYYFADGASVFVIKGEWIALRSESLRRGDRVDVYALGTVGEGDETVGSPESIFTKLGTFRVCFVKDVNECEVTGTDDPSGHDFDGTPILARANASGEVYSVEIIATPEEYARILQAVREADGEALRVPATVRKNGTAGLMLVQVTG